MLLNDFYVIQSINQENDTLSATVKLNKDHSILQGHFPGNPVVPGVCLMTMAKEVLEHALGQKLVIAEAKSIKFLGVVNPVQQATLQIKCDIVLQETDFVKTNCTITAGEMVCYKASVSYIPAV